MKRPESRSMLQCDKFSYPFVVTQNNPNSVPNLSVYALFCVEFFPLGPELVCNHVTYLLQVDQAFLESIHSIPLCSRRSARYYTKRATLDNSPYIWMRMFILGSDGCGMAYAQNSTSGLDQIC